MAATGIDIIRLIRNRELRRRLFDAGFYFADYRRRISSSSKVIHNMGLTADELRGDGYRARVHPDDLASYEALWERVQEGWEQQFYAEYRFRGADDGYHWVRTNALVIDRDPEGRVETVVGIDENIDSRKRAEDYLRTQFLETKSRFEIAESLRVAGTVMTSDLELAKSLEIGLGQLGQIINVHRVEVFLRNVDEFELVAELGSYEGGKVPDLTPLLNEAVGSMFPIIRDDLGEGLCHRSWIGLPLRFAGRTMGAVMIWHREAGYYRGADLYPIMAFGDSLSVAINNGQRFLEAVTDLETDALTGFLTRKSFERNAATLWDDITSHHSVVAVVMMDLDYFKRVNDKYGHLTGDEVIQGVAGVCRSTLRKDDLLGRFGGEEFIAILPGANKEAAERVLERIRAGCESLEVPGVDWSVTISVGVVISQGDEDLKAAIAAADSALLEAKARGRNRIVFAPGEP